MDELKIATIDLAGVAGINHQERLEKMYEWYFDDSAERAKILFGTALSSLLTLLFDFIKGDTTQHPGLAAGVAVVGFVSLLLGWLYFRRVRLITAEFVDDLRLLTDALAGGGPFREFIRTLYGGQP